MSRSLALRATGCVAALIVLLGGVGAGMFLSRASATQPHRHRAARTAAATDSSAEFKLVYTGTYSYNYTDTSDDTGALADQSSASYNWTYSGLQKLTATQGGNPLTDTGTFQMSSSGQQSETNDNFNCTFASGPHDTFPDTTISDPAVGREKATTPISFSWDIDNPPSPPNATQCADGTSLSELSFPIPPGGSEVSPGSFFQPQDNALEAAIRTGATVGGPTVPITVHYGQLPYTLPVSLDVPEHSFDTGYQTQSGSLQLEGKVTLSAVSNSCPVGTSASAMPIHAHAASDPGLTVRAGSGQGRSEHFFAFRIKLSAYAGGACKLPYHFIWTRTDMPKPNVPGAKVTVMPKVAGPFSAAGSNAIQVTLTCQLSRARRRAINRDLTPCWGPVDYHVAVKDSSKPVTGSADVHLYWAPECLSKATRAADLKERGQLEQQFYRELVADKITGFPLDKVIEYVTAGEFAPALFVKDVTDLSVKAAKAWQRAEQLDDFLSEPNC